MIFIAHRGFRIGCDENTFHAFNKSVEMEMDYIELDVQLCKDGKLCVLHDETLDRTFDATGKISKKKYSELSKIQSRNFNYKLPLFSEVIENYIVRKLNSNPIKLMVELKGKKTARASCEIISSFPKEVQDFIVFSGRDLKRLRKAYEIFPNIPQCLNITSSKDFKLKDLFICNNSSELPIPFKMISLKSNQINDRKFIEVCHKVEALALAWNFLDYPQPDQKIIKLINLGIDGILFDSPHTVPIIREHLKKSD